MLAYLEALQFNQKPGFIQQLKEYEKELNIKYLKIFFYGNYFYYEINFNIKIYF